MGDKPNRGRADNLPPNVMEFIRQVVRKMGWSGPAREEVAAELLAHFEDELRDCPDGPERQQKAQRLIEEFGDAKLLAALCRRGKNRCRSFWVKAAVRSLQAAGACVLFLVLYVVWFVNGKPSIKVDYLVLLNQIGQTQVAERDNAWPYYERAMALVIPDREPVSIPAYLHPEYAEHREFSRLPEDAQKTIVGWIEANHAAWEQFALAGSKTYCIRSYRYAFDEDEPWLMHAKGPDVRSLMQLSKMGIWLSRLRLMPGRTGDALDACLILARAGRHWQQSGFVTEQLLGIGLSKRAHDEILTILGHQKLSAAELADLYRQLATVYSPSYPLLGLQEEHLVFWDVVQHLFTDGGPGGGHLIPSRTAEAMIPATHLPGTPETPPLYWKAVSLIHAGRNETVAKAHEIFDLQDKFARMSPYERRTFKGVRADLAFFLQWPQRYALVQTLAPAVDRPANLAFQAKALHEATLAVVALRRYRFEKGSYPGTLEELKQAGYLDTLPADPYAKGRLIYKVTGDAFTLYSVGPNFQDDGGKSGMDSKGRPQMWASFGDTVFWPVP